MQQNIWKSEGVDIMEFIKKRATINQFLKKKSKIVIHE